MLGRLVTEPFLTRVRGARGRAMYSEPSGLAPDLAAVIFGDDDAGGAGASAFRAVRPGAERFHAEERRSPKERPARALGADGGAGEIDSPGLAGLDVVHALGHVHGVVPDALQKADHAQKQRGGPQRAGVVLHHQH